MPCTKCNPIILALLHTASKIEHQGDNSTPILDLLFKRFGASKNTHGPKAPPEIRKQLVKYYNKCLGLPVGATKSPKGVTKDKKAYCSRVAWNIFCSHVNPEYPGCTEHGKTWGPPYSGPLSKK